MKGKDIPASSVILKSHHNVIKFHKEAVHAGKKTHVMAAAANINQDEKSISKCRTLAT